MAENPPPPVAGTFVWNELMSRDIEAAKKFYAAVLGWEYHGMDMGPMDTYWIIQAGAHQGAGGMMAMPKDVPAHVPGHWMPYVAVQDVNAAFAKAGAAALYPPMDVPDVGRMFAVADPSGASLSLMTNAMGVRKGKPAPEKPDHGRFMWNELVSSDTEKAGKFLCDLVGWQAARIPHEAGFEYTLFQVEGENVAGMMPLGKPHWGDVPSHWMSYIAVKDIAQVHKAVGNAGGKVMVPPTPAMGYGTFIVAADPSGAVVSFMQPAG